VCRAICFGASWRRSNAEHAVRNERLEIHRGRPAPCASILDHRAKTVRVARLPPDSAVFRARPHPS
jgi:hypothetical protein